jgi:hypothetical protein
LLTAPTTRMMETIPITCANPYLVVNIPFAKVDSSGWNSFCVFAVDASLHNSLLWRHFHRYSDFARLHAQLQEAAGEYGRALPPLPPKVFSPLAPDVVRERQKLLPAFLRELLAICRNDYGEELLADICRPLVDEWLVTDPAAPADEYAPFRHQFPIVRGAADVAAPLEQHRQHGGLWLALVAAIRIQTQFRRWCSAGGLRRRRRRADAAVPVRRANAALVAVAAAPLVPRSPRDLRPVPRSVALDDSPAKRPLPATGGLASGLLLERMRTLSAQSGSPLVERMKALNQHHRELALAASPRAAPDDGPRYQVLRAAVVRQGYQLDSLQAGVVHAGAEIVALEERSTVAAAACDGARQQQQQQQQQRWVRHFRVRFSGGWVSGRVATGGGHGSEPILKLLADPAISASRDEQVDSEEAEEVDVVLDDAEQSTDLVVSSTAPRLGRPGGEGLLGHMKHTLHLGARALQLVRVQSGVSAATGMPHRDVVEQLQIAPRPLKVRAVELARVQEQQRQWREQQRERQQQQEEEEEAAAAKRPADSPHTIWRQKEEVVQLMNVRLRQSPASPSPTKQQRAPLRTISARNSSAKKMIAALNSAAATS